MSEQCLDVQLFCDNLLFFSQTDNFRVILLNNILSEGLKITHLLPLNDLYNRTTLKWFLC